MITILLQTVNRYWQRKIL